MRLLRPQTPLLDKTAIRSLISEAIHEAAAVYEYDPIKRGMAESILRDAKWLVREKVAELPRKRAFTVIDESERFIAQIEAHLGISSQEWHW